MPNYEKSKAQKDISKKCPKVTKMTFDEMSKGKNDKN